MNAFKRNLTSAIYDDDRQTIRKEASAADLFHLAFGAPNACESDIVAKMTANVVDEIGIIIEALDSDEPDLMAIQRMLMRIRDRLAIAPALAERFAEADEGGS